MQDKIIDKIRKILAKADPANNPSMEEVEVALSLAQQLALKYGVDLDKIQSDVKEEVVTKKVDLGTKSTPTWAGIIVNIVAKNHRVKCYKSIHGDSSDLLLMGLERDVDVAMVVALYAVSTARVMWDKYLKEIKKQRKTTRSASLALRNDYMDGFAVGISENYKKNVEENGLVPVVPGLVAQAFEAMHLVTSADTRMKMGNPDAYARGVRDGRDMASRKVLS